MAENRIELLNKLLDVAEKAETDIEFLETMITNPVIPPVVRVRFAEIQSTLSMQAHLIKHFTAGHFETKDDLEEIRQMIEALPKQK